MTTEKTTKNKDVFFKKFFSIDNENYPQIIVQLSNGEYWSCILYTTGWEGLLVDFSTLKNRVVGFNYDSKKEGESFTDLQSAIWEAYHKPIL